MGRASIPIMTLLVLSASENPPSSPLLRFKVDTSAEGCTGLFWRVWSAQLGHFELGPNQADPPWPRNGAILEGRLSENPPGYLLFDGGLALPFHDEAKRYTYLHAIAETRTGFLPLEPPVERSKLHDVLIIGSGPAGLSAAVYARRNKRSVVVVGGPHPGGAMMLAKAVENFPSAKIAAGAELLGHLVQQAAGFGARFLDGTVDSLTAVPVDGDPKSMGLNFQVTMQNSEILQGRSVIVASGAREKWLEVPGEEHLRGKFLHTCAYCDGVFYEGKDVCVVGGGDGALEAVSYLARVAKSVHLIHRRETWRGSARTVQRISGLPSVTILRPYTVEGWRLQGASLVGASLKHVQTGERRTVDCSGAFIAIGRHPQAQFVPATVGRDARGFLLHQQHSMTALAGCFIAGQVADGRYQQAVTAAADGAKAAMDAVRWLDGDLDTDSPNPEAPSIADPRAMRGSTISVTSDGTSIFVKTFPLWVLLQVALCVFVAPRFFGSSTLRLLGSAARCPKVL